MAVKFQLPAGFGQLDLTDWFRGLVSGFISGGASAVSSGFVASALSKDLALGTEKFFVMVGSVFLASGVLNMMAFLRTRPLPDLKSAAGSAEKGGDPGK